MSMLSIGDLCKKILRPILLSPQKRGKEKDVAVTICRRIEVTVERETVSVIVPGERPVSSGQNASREPDFEVNRLELPAPLLPAESADSGQAEHPKKHPSEWPAGF